MELKDIQKIIKDNEKIIIGDNLEIKKYSGIINYYPDELVLKVKAGTKLAEIKQMLNANNQDLAFIYDENKTIGSIYANGGHNVRMSILGVQIIDGRGDILEFGGEVMKNVAGFDVARMLCGSKGKCCVITNITFKVLPQTFINVKSDNMLKNQQDFISNLNQKIYQVFDPLGKFN